jgi:hypothetical protein
MQACFVPRRHNMSLHRQQQLALYGATFIGNGVFQDESGRFKTSDQGPAPKVIYKVYISGKRKGQRAVFMSQSDYEDLQIPQFTKEDQLRQQRIALDHYHMTVPQRES